MSMLKTEDQISLVDEFNQKGFLLIKDELKTIPIFEKLIIPDSEKVFEKDGKTLRSVYGFQENPYFLEWLSSNTYIKEITTEILGNEVYIHQSKINIKNNTDNSVWPYHRDFPFWNIFDGFSKNEFLNVVVFLDDVMNGSGELIMIPNTHRHFLKREENDKLATFSLEGSASDDLLFSFTEEEVLFFKKKYGEFQALGPKGSILFFDANVIHGSGKSNSDFSRKIMILTFNKCSNFSSKKSLRPNYLSNQNCLPVKW